LTTSSGICPGYLDGRLVVHGSPEDPESVVPDVVWEIALHLWQQYKNIFKKMSLYTIIVLMMTLQKPVSGRV
jgi:hypothetical protein